MNNFVASLKPFYARRFPDDHTIMIRFSGSFRLIPTHRFTHGAMFFKARSSSRSNAGWEITHSVHLLLCES